MLYRKIIPAIALLLALGACSTTDGVLGDIDAIFQGKERTQTGEVVYLDPLPEGDAIEAGRDHPLPPSYTMDMGYDSIASEMVNESVELFSLEQPNTVIAPTRYQPGASRRSAGRDDFGYEGMPSSTDPSVTVFPFTNDMYTPGIHAAARGYRKDAGFAGDISAFPSTNIDNLPLYTGNPNTIYFDHGSAALSAVARQAIASAAASNHGARITVEAHASQRAAVTDPVQRAEVNMKMSMKRAMVVTKALIAQGIPANMIKTTALGDTKPAVPEVDREAEALNRRVQILQRP